MHLDGRECLATFQDARESHRANRPPREGVSVLYGGSSELTYTVTRYVTDGKVDLRVDRRFRTKIAIAPRGISESAVSSGVFANGDAVTVPPSDAAENGRNCTLSVPVVYQCLAKVAIA